MKVVGNVQTLILTLILTQTRILILIRTQKEAVNINLAQRMTKFK